MSRNLNDVENKAWTRIKSELLHNVWNGFHFCSVRDLNTVKKISVTGYIKHTFKEDQDDLIIGKTKR